MAANHNPASKAAYHRDIGADEDVHRGRVTPVAISPQGGHNGISAIHEGRYGDHGGMERAGSANCGAVPPSKPGSVWLSETDNTSSLETASQAPLPRRRFEKLTQTVLSPCSVTSHILSITGSHCRRSSSGESTSKK